MLDFASVHVHAAYRCSLSLLSVTLIVLCTEFVRAQSGLGVHPIGAILRSLMSVSVLILGRCIDPAEVSDDFLGKSHLTEKLLEIAHHDRAQLVLSGLIAVYKAIDVILVSSPIVELCEVGGGASRSGRLLLSCLLFLYEIGYLESLLLV